LPSNRFKQLMGPCAQAHEEAANKLIVMKMSNLCRTQHDTDSETGSDSDSEEEENEGGALLEHRVRAPPAAALPPASAQRPPAAARVNDYR
jgi:hypothetical protein